MPFTPFHFGPGYLVKSLFMKRFHFLAFVVSQVLIDLETAYNLIRQNVRWHTFLHTYLGSLTIIPIGYILIWVSTKLAKKIQFPLIQKVFSEELNTKVILISLLIGVWSHVLLDSIMHSDVRPFWPLANKNNINKLIGVGYLHLFCIVCAAIGLIWSRRAELKRGLK